MRGSILVAVVALGLSFGACKRRTPAKPLAEAILGEWDVWCRTDKESTSTCLGKEDSGLYKTFEPGGRFVLGSHANASPPQEGTWTLAGDELVLTMKGGGLELTERYRARIVGQRLVLWDASHGFGAVFGRAGAAFAAASGPTTAGGSVTHQIGDVRYTIALPSGYRLTRDDNHRQRWAPASGTGFQVDLSLSPRAHEEVDGKDVVRPCNDRDDGGVSSSSATIDGVERDTDIGLSFCIDHTDQVLMCSTGHSRGYLEPTEEDAALALCKSLKIRG